MQSTREIDSCIFYDAVYIGVIEKGENWERKKEPCSMEDNAVIWLRWVRAMWFEWVFSNGPFHCVCAYANILFVTVWVCAFGCCCFSVAGFFRFPSSNSALRVSVRIHVVYSVHSIRMHSTSRSTSIECLSHSIECAMCSTHTSCCMRRISLKRRGANVLMCVYAVHGLWYTHSDRYH